MSCRSQFCRVGLLLLCHIGAIGNALAIGEAEACQMDRSRFILAIASGTSAEIEDAVELHVAAQYSQLGVMTRLSHAAVPALHSAWRAKVIRDYVNNGPCDGDIKPLDFAVHWGNLEATQWLLEHGADPNAWSYPSGEAGKPHSNLYTRCGIQLFVDKAGSPDGEVRKRRIEAFGLTIQAGGDVRFRYSDQATALSACTDTDLLKLIVEAGLKPGPKDLENAVNVALGCHPITFDPYCHNAFGKIAFFVERGVMASERLRLVLASPHCGRAYLWRGNEDALEPICTQVRRLTGITPGKVSMTLK